MKATFDSERHEIVTHSFNRLTTIAALDIGSSKVCCVIARISRDQKISIAGYGYNASKGIKNGIITDIKQATYSVCDAVEAAEQMANERVSRIIVNISGDRVKSSIKRSAINLNKSKPVSEADIKKVIEKGINKINVENNELIHCLPTGYRLDFGEETNDPRNLYGESLSVDVLLGLVPEIMYRNVKTVLDNSHLEIAEKALSSYASGLACLVDDEKELGATVVDIGGGTTSIASFKRRQQQHHQRHRLGADDLVYPCRAFKNAARLRFHDVARQKRNHQRLPGRRGRRQPDQTGAEIGTDRHHHPAGGRNV